MDAATIESYRGLGGYELLGRSMDKIKETDFANIRDVCNRLQLQGLILVGGARTSTDAAYLAEYLLGTDCETAVVCIPVDMGCSIKNQFVEATVGFDTATKVSSQIVGQST